MPLGLEFIWLGELQRRARALGLPLVPVVRDGRIGHCVSAEGIRSLLPAAEAEEVIGLMDAGHLAFRTLAEPEVFR